MVDVTEDGRIITRTPIENGLAVSDVFYPLVGNEVETEVVCEGNTLTVQPNTYLQRVFFDGELP